MCLSVALCLVDTIQFFSLSLSNFTCKLFMMRGVTLLILVHRVKGQHQFWHSAFETLCGHDIDCSFCPIIFKLIMKVVDDESRNNIDYYDKRSKVNISFDAQLGLETYFFSHSQTFASGFNLNSQIAVSNSQLVFPTLNSFNITLPCGVAILFLGVGTWFMVLPSIDRGLAGAFEIHYFFGHFRQMTRQPLRLFNCLYCRLTETSLRPRLGFGIRRNIELATFFECLYFQLAKLNFNSHFASLQA